MKALLVSENQSLSLQEVPIPIPAKGEVRIKLKAAALNKRDYWISHGKYPNVKEGVILGSDGAGIVDEIGRGVPESWLKSSVVINPNINWGENNDAQGKAYSVLGMPSNGSFAEYITVGVDRLVEIPAHLTFNEAACLPLAGLTAFRACFHHGGVVKNKKVLITGFGGGVAHFAFLFAMAAGATVSVTSGSAENINKAMEMGAFHGFNYNEANWIQSVSLTTGGFDLIIDSAGGDQFNSLIKLLNPAGRIVFYGASNGLPTSIDLFRLFWKQGTIQGSTMGSDKEFVAMIAFIEKNKIRPLVSAEYTFDYIIEAIEQMGKASLPGKTVIVI